MENICPTSGTRDSSSWGSRESRLTLEIRYRMTMSQETSPRNAQAGQLVASRSRRPSMIKFGVDGEPSMGKVLFSETISHACLLKNKRMTVYTVRDKDSEP